MTNIVQLDNKILNRIARDILAAWKQNHGSENGQAHAIKGAGCILVFIEDAFTRAELYLAEKDAGQNQTLNRYVQHLLEHICQEQTGNLEKQTAAEVVATSVSADTAAGWALCLFKLADSEGLTAS